MIEEIVNELAETIYTNKKLSRNDLRLVTEIFCHYNNIKLNDFHFMRNKVETKPHAYYMGLCNNLNMDYDQTVRVADKMYLNARNRFDLDKTDYRNFYLLWVLFHELTHAIQFNTLFDNKLNELVVGSSTMFIKNYKDLYHENHDLVTIERDANTEAMYLINNILNKIISTDLIYYTQTSLFSILLNDYYNV